MISMSHCPITPASPASGIASSLRPASVPRVLRANRTVVCRGGPALGRRGSGAKSCTSMPPRWTPMPRGRDSIAPRFYVKEHLDELFTGEELPNLSQEEDSVAMGDGGGGGSDSPGGRFLRTALCRRRGSHSRERCQRRLDLPKRPPETRAKRRLV